MLSSQFFEFQIVIDPEIVLFEGLYLGFGQQLLNLIVTFLECLPLGLVHVANNVSDFGLLNFVLLCLLLILSFFSLTLGLLRLDFLLGLASLFVLLFHFLLQGFLSSDESFTLRFLHLFRRLHFLFSLAGGNLLSQLVTL